MKEAGGEIKTLLTAEPLIHKESWYYMKGWYKDTADRAPPPAQVTLGWIMAERVTLYRQVQPPGENTSLSVKPFPV